MTGREKMLAGELYDPFDPELVAARVTRDIPERILAEANPCRVIRALEEDGGDGGH